MISSTLGAPSGGTTRGGHQVVDPVAFSLIPPPNGGGAGGRQRPSMMTVALGLPGVPWTTPSAEAGAAAPLVCALTLPDRNELPKAVAIAAFPVGKNNCRRFIPVSLVGSAMLCAAHCGIRCDWLSYRSPADGAPPPPSKPQNRNVAPRIGPFMWTL